jgi:hypothetical protein
MISVSAIRDKLNQLVGGKIALDEFEDWIVAESWNMHQHSDPIAQAFVSAIELRLAEYSDGHLSISDMIDEFRLLLAGRRVFNVRLNADPIVHGSGSSISVEKVDLPNLVAGTRPLAEYELLLLRPE